MMRDNIEVDLLEGSDFCLDGKLQDVIERLQSMLDKVPDELKSEVKLHIYGEEEITINYLRPKTLEEISEEKKHFRENLSAEVERAEATFLYLKRKLQESE